MTDTPNRHLSGAAEPPGRPEELFSPHAQQTIDALTAETVALRHALKIADRERREASEALAKATKELNRAMARRDAARNELSAVYGSASWRLTAPLRRFRKASNEGRLRPGRIVRGLVRRVFNRPFLRRFAKQAISRFPVAGQRLRRIAVRLGLAYDAPTAAARPRSPSPHLSQGSLSPKAARVLDELVSAMSKATR